MEISWIRIYPVLMILIIVNLLIIYKLNLSTDLNKVNDVFLTEAIKGLAPEKKEHLRGFILNSMREMLKSEYPGDLAINAIGSSANVYEKNIKHTKIYLLYIILY